MNGRMILVIVCGSYLLSAALLTWMKLAGKPVTAGSIVGWGVTGLLGLCLVPMLKHHAWAIATVEMLVLVPWMIWATVGDFRAGHGVMGWVDVSGVVAIGLGLWSACR